MFYHQGLSYLSESLRNLKTWYMVKVYVSYHKSKRGVMTSPGFGEKGFIEIR